MTSKEFIDNYKNNIDSNAFKNLSQDDLEVLELLLVKFAEYHVKQHRQLLIEEYENVLYYYEPNYKLENYSYQIK
jgi:hypothetical protein